MTRHFWTLFAFMAIAASILTSMPSGAQGLGVDPPWTDVRIDREADAAELRLDVNALRRTLVNAPDESAARNTRATPLIVELPGRGGVGMRFVIREAAILDETLSNQYPQIRSYAGELVEDKATRIRMSVTPEGVHAWISHSDGTATVIQPTADGTHAVSPPSERLHRTVDAAPPETLEQDTGPGREDEERREPAALELSNGTNLRIYRTAVATTGEFATLYGGGTVAGSLAAATNLFTFVNAVFERDLAVRFVIVAGTDQIIYTDAATDPFSNGSSSAQLNINQANTDVIIGSANYDIGHLLTTDNGGVAQLGAAGLDGSKARGMSGSSFGNLQSLALEILAHELGHQFDASHSFNGVDFNCVNRTNVSAVEPASGTTIMSYAGICASDNIQADSEGYFHSFSLEQMISWINGPNAVAPVATGNTPPVASAGVDGAIPANTPYVLSGSGTDANGDGLTYTWEQIDTGTGAPLIAPDYADGPLIRSYAPTASPVRYVPNLELLASGASNPNTACASVACWVESLPNQARAINMQFTARDNRANGGGTDSEELAVAVVDTGAAFAITSQNITTTFALGSSMNVAWNVAGTVAAPISAPLVDILLSTDGGLTFPTTLASSVANDGSQTITVPAINTSVARIMVIQSGAGNGVRFFSMNQANLVFGDGGCVDNNDFVCATAVATATPENSNNTAYNTENGEPSRTCGGSTQATSWFNWTAPSNGQATAAIISGSFDTAMSVYTGAAVSGLTEVICDDDGGSGQLSSAVFTATAGTTYRVQVGGFNGATGTFTLNVSFVPDATTGSGLTVLSQACPVYDSFNAQAGPLTGGQTETLQVTGVLPAGQGAPAVQCVPANATAVVFTVVAVDPVGAGNLRLYPAGVATTGGVVNYANNGLNNTNTVTIPLGTGAQPGQVTVEANAGPGGIGAVSTHVRLAVQGYYAPTGGWRYNPLTPCAVADSRANQGPTGAFVGPFTPGEGPPNVDVTGVIPAAQGSTGAGTNCGVPDTAEGVVVNIVAVNTTGGSGYLSAGPGSTSPTEYVTSFAPLGRNNAAVAYMPLAGDGTINIDVITLSGIPTVGVRIVVLGYLDATAGLGFTPVGSCAAFDSRPGQNSTGGFVGLRTVSSTTTYGLANTIPVAQGGAGAGVDCGVPTGATAVLVNLVGNAPVGAGNLRASAAGTVATGGVLNFRDLVPPTSNSNAVPVPLSTNGELDVFVNSGVPDNTPFVHVRGVLFGYYS